MKLKLIVTLMLTNLSIGDRQQRSTVLTDESKRVLEHFDFSNFDKQEALNYLDRQRYDNQIRGKRSRPKLRRYPMRLESCHVNGDIQREFPYNNIIGQELETNDDLSLPSDNLTAVHESFNWHSNRPKSYQILPMDPMLARKRRGHRHKKKQRIKQFQDPEEIEEYDEDEADMERYRKRRRKKKKRKRYWSNWSQWSPCSVTCGRGRKVRWRKCIVKNCTNGEVEMGEKTCQLPACSLLTKLLAVIKNIKLGSNLLKPTTLT